MVFGRAGQLGRGLGDFTVADLAARGRDDDDAVETVSSVTALSIDPPRLQEHHARRGAARRT